MTNRYVSNIVNQDGEGLRVLRITGEGVGGKRSDVTTEERDVMTGRSKILQRWWFKYLTRNGKVTPNQWKTTVHLS